MDQFRAAGLKKRWYGKGSLRPHTHHCQTASRASTKDVEIWESMVQVIHGVEDVSVRNGPDLIDGDDCGDKNGPTAVVSVRRLVGHVELHRAESIVFRPKTKVPEILAALTSMFTNNVMEKSCLR